MSHTSQVSARRPSAILALFVVLAACSLGACTTPAPPKPAMVPIGQTGDFGYSMHDLDANRIEVTYTGAAVRVPTDADRDDAAVRAELAKTHDLALWRAAQIADERGMEALKIEKETRDTDINVSRQVVARPAPFYRPYHWGPYGYRYGYYGYPGWFYDDPYYYRTVRRAAGRVTTTLTVQLLKTRDPNDAAQLSVPDTLAKLKTERSGAVY
jgi:hypothetical protein